MRVAVDGDRAPGEEGPDITLGSLALLGADIAFGATDRILRVSARVGSMAWGTGSAAGRLARALPGAGTAYSLVRRASAPLVDEGRVARNKATAELQRAGAEVLTAMVPAAVETLDLDEVLAHIDVNRLLRRIDLNEVIRRIDVDELVGRIAVEEVVERIDIDRLVQRISIDALVRQMDVNALVQRIDMDALLRRIDINAVVKRIDVNELVQRVDIESVVEDTELGAIVSRSASGFASEAVDAARSQTADIDTLVQRVVNRVLRRSGASLPAGPPLLVGKTGGEAAGGDPDRGAEASADAHQGGSGEQGDRDG